MCRDLEFVNKVLKEKEKELAQLKDENAIQKKIIKQINQTNHRMIDRFILTINP